jgi:hypothetical protein
VAGEGDVRGVADADDGPQQDLSLISKALSGPTTLAPTDVDGALALAVDSRTPDGGVDSAAVGRLVDALPVIDVLGAPSGTALADFVSHALGRDDLRLVPVEGPGAKGQSGAPVSLIRDGSGAVIAIAKTFPNAAEFVRELSSLQRLASPEFTRVHIPDPLAVAVTHTPQGPAGVLVTTAAPGRAIDDMITAAGTAHGIERSQRLAELSTAISDTAAALAELHTGPTGSGGRVDPGYLDFHLGEARRGMDRVMGARELYESLDLPVDDLSRRLDEAIALARQHELGAALVHGDAHPGNFFWHPQHGVTFIDTPTFHFSMDDTGSPIASPERDISNFQQRLDHYGRRLGLEQAEITQLQSTFLQVYRDAGGAHLDAEAMNVFNARSVLNKLLDIGRRVQEMQAQSIEGESSQLTGMLDALAGEARALLRVWGIE